MLEIRNLEKIIWQESGGWMKSVFLCPDGQIGILLGPNGAGSRRSSRVLQDCSVIRGRSGSRRFRQDSWRQSGIFDMCGDSGNV